MLSVDMLRSYNSFLLLLAACVGCSCAASSKEHVKPSSSAPALKKTSPDQRTLLTRSEWLSSAKKVTLLPQAKLPRIGNAAFDNLLRGEAWRTVHPNHVFVDKALLVFFPAIKQLHLRYSIADFSDEALELALLQRAFQRAFIIAAIQAIQARSEPQETKAVRIDGLKKAVIGAAMLDIAMLGRSVHASPARRSKVLALLQQEASYKHYTREALQLFQVTLHQATNAPIFGQLQNEISKIRLALGKALSKVPDTSKVKTTYEALPGAWDRSKQPRRVLSNTGRFSVIIAPGAIVKKVETPLANGVFRQHVIRFQQANATFEAMCSDAKAKHVVSNMLKGGATNLGQHPKGGTLLFFKKRNAKLRIVARGDAVCVAGVEDPRHEVQASAVTQFLSSFTMLP